MLRYYLDSLSVYLYVRLPIVLYLCFHISTYLSSLCTSYSHSLILYAFFSLRYVSIFVSCSVYALVCTYLVLNPLSAYVCLLIGTYIFCHQCTYICMHVSMYECTDLCMYVSMYVCIDVCVLLCTFLTFRICFFVVLLYLMHSSLCWQNLFCNLNAFVRKHFLSTLKLL